MALAIGVIERLKTKILYPSDYFDIKRVDADYELEYNVACNMPEFDIMLYNYDEFISGGVFKSYPYGLDGGLCIYRGWMLKPNKYDELYEKLKSIDIILINDVNQYKTCHLFPYSYEEIKDFTPKTKWYDDYKQIDWKTINSEFKRFMIKDYVKSVKGTNFPSCFDAPVEAETMNKCIDEFIHLRGSLFTNGIVIKEYVNFKKYGEITNEYRAFYMYGKLVTVSRNSNQSENCPFVPIEFVEKFKGLRSNFYTVDFAELDNGSWIIIEVGDGQVSELSPNQYVFKFYDEIRAIVQQG